MEIWLDVPVQELKGFYQISNTGLVRSLDRLVNSGYNSKRLCKGRIIRPSIDRYGYLKLVL